MKDKSKFKALRIEAQKCWQNKQAEAKHLKKAVEHATGSPKSEKSNALIQLVEPSISHPQEQPDHAEVWMDGAALPLKSRPRES